MLSEEEVAALVRLPQNEHAVPESLDIVVEGSRPVASILLIEGYCARYTLLLNGSRQITAMHIPGDFVGLHSFLIKRMDHAVLTLTPCRVAEVRHETLRAVTSEYPHLARLLWLTTLTDAAIHRQWLVTMGAQNALSHFAHFACEMYGRLKAVGRVQQLHFTLPMTQTELGDTLGLSAVHTNRVLQELRGKRLLSWTGNEVQILDWDRLREVAMFDPTYLSSWQEPR